MDKKRLLTPILVMGTFGILCTETGVIGILPRLAVHFGVDVSQAGLFVSLFALAVAISGATLPAALSKMNRKTMMLMVLGVFVLGNIVFAFAPTFEVALVARIVPAFLHPVYCSAAFALAASSVSESEAPKAASKVMMGVSAGMVVGVPVANLIATSLSVEAVILVFAALNSVVFLATLLLVPSMPVAKPMRYRDQVSSAKSPLALISLVAALCIQAAIFAVYAYVSEYLDVVGIAGSLQTMTLLGFGVASLVGNFVAGRLLSTIARRLLIVFPLVVAIIYALLFLGGAFVPFVVAVVLLWGAAYGAGNNIQQFVTSTAMPNAPDFANGLFISFGNIGITVGTAVGGVLLAGFGVQATVAAALLFVVLSLVMLVVRGRLMAHQNVRAGDVS